METQFDMELDRTPLIQYHWITDTIAVGSLYSKYDAFDVIVNLAYRYDGDGFMKHEIRTSEEQNKFIIKIGLHDMPGEPIDKILERLIPVLVDCIQTDPTLKILFHCQAGISRSSSCAIALLAKLNGLTFDEALRVAQSKRAIIQPNEGFCKMVKKFLGE